MTTKTYPTTTTAQIRKDGKWIPIDKTKKFANLPTVRRKTRDRGLGQLVYTAMEDMFNSDTRYEFRSKDLKPIALANGYSIKSVGPTLASLYNERDLERIGYGLYVLKELEE